MSSGSQSRAVTSSGKLLLAALAAIVVTLATAESASAQIHGIPPSVTSIQNHFPPYLPNIPPSVTSLGPFGAVGPPAFPVYSTVPGWYGHGFGNRHGGGYGGGHKGAYGYSTGAYIAPYYIPVYDPSYGYDTGEGGGAPYVYSGPPPEQTLHIVVDTPAANHIPADEDYIDGPPSAAARSKQNSDAGGATDAAPVDPTVLVFRDGHQEEVSNYAIMGQTVYVFDARTHKIALSDLDVSATVKANDQRGVEFHIPRLKPS